MTVKGERSESAGPNEGRPLTGSTETAPSHVGEAETPPANQRTMTVNQAQGLRNQSEGPTRLLYDVPEAMTLLCLSRTQLYELIRTRRLLTVTVGRRRLVPATSITDYVALLLREAERRDGRAA